MKGSVSLLLFVLCFTPSLVAETLHPVKLEKGTLQKWCHTEDQNRVRFSNLLLEQEGYFRCGEIESVALCGPLGEKYIGPALSAPASYKDCGLGPRIYIEKNGVPVDVARVMRTSEDKYPSKGNRNEDDSFTGSNQSFNRLDEAFDQVSKALGGEPQSANRKKPYGVSPGEGLSPTEAYGQIDQLLGPLLNGPYGKVLEELTGQPLPDLNETGRGLERHFDAYRLGDNFFED